MSPKLSSDSTPFSSKCIFYQNFDRPWCTMVSIGFVSDSQQKKLYDYVEKGEREDIRNWRLISLLNADYIEDI